MHHDPVGLPDRNVISSGHALHTAALAASGALAAVTALGAADRPRAQPSPERDARALGLLLLVARAEVALRTAAGSGSGSRSRSWRAGHAGGYCGTRSVPAR